MAKGDFATVHSLMVAMCFIAYLVSNLFSMNLEYSFLYSYSGISIYSYVLGMFLVFLGACLARYFFSKEIKHQALVFTPSLKVFFVSLVLYYLTFAFALLYTSDGILLRYNYQFFEEAGSGIGLSFLELLIAVLPSVVLFNAPSRRFFIFISYFAVFTSCLYLYGTGTKLAVAALVFFVLVSVGRDKKITFASMILIILTIPLLSMVLNQRNFGLYGVYTFLDQVSLLFTHTSDMFSFSFAVFTSSIYIYIETLNAADLSIGDLLIEINPMSGISAGWYDVAEYHRINYAVPFSGFATLYHHSPVLLVFFGFFVQQLMNYFSYYFSELFKKDLRIISVLLSFYLWNMMASYNFRASMRWLYLVLFFTLFLAFLCKIKRRRLNA